MGDTTPPAWGQTFFLCIVLAACYAAFGRLAFWLSSDYGVTSVVFVPEGIALAFCILFGSRVAPGIFFGQAILALGSGGSLPSGLTMALVNSLEGILGGRLFHSLSISLRFDRPRDVVLFVVMIFLVLQPVSAAGAGAAFFLSGNLPADVARPMPPWVSDPVVSSPLSLLAPVMERWWLANSLGQLLVTPLLLAWTLPVAQLQGGNRLDMLLGGGALLIVLLALSGVPAPPLFLLALLYAILVWIGIGRGLRAITLANLLIGAAITWTAVSGKGFLSHMAMADRLVNVGYFIAIACSFSLMLFAMFEERRGLIEQLRYLASVDPLVGLSNRRQFIENARNEIEKARRNATDTVMLMLDVDHFKQINDRYGHAAGDFALKALAQTCRRTVREDDLIGRVGGEEFAFLLPATTIDEGYRIAERLRAEIAATPLQLDGEHVLPMTVSIGIAPFDGLISLDTLRRRADKALYSAKESGRNRVSVAMDDGGDDPEATDYPPQLTVALKSA